MRAVSMMACRTAGSCRNSSASASMSQSAGTFKDSHVQIRQKIKMRPLLRCAKRQGAVGGDAHTRVKLQDNALRRGGVPLICGLLS